MRPAVQSAEVAEEDEDDGSVGPQVAETVGYAIPVREGHVFEPGEVHVPEGTRPSGTSAAVTPQLVATALPVASNDWPVPAAA